MVRYLLLGSVEAVSDAGPISIGRPRLRGVLAYLLLHANRPVTTDLLVEAVWGGGRGPTTARTQIQTDISIIRRLLRDDAGRSQIDTRPGGYLINIEPEQLDILEFGLRVSESACATDPAEAIAALRAALALWRGRPLTGVTAAYAEAARDSLQEQRLQAYTSLMALELDLGRHADLIPELTALVDSHPLHERLTGQLMLALYRDGRQAEALGVARSLRATLADQHGLEPCQATRDLERAILQQDVTLDLPASPAHAVTLAPTIMIAADMPPPAQLPPDTTDFTGRAIHLRQLDRLLPNGDRASPPVVVAGLAGVGKTALAVHWGHSAAPRFPDGQLYIDVRGYSSDRPLTPLETLGKLLRALGAPADRIPTDVDEASAMYRTMLAGRRMLVLIDNVHRVDWLRPVLPAAPGCLCLVTSRSQLGGLVAVEAAQPVTLDVLTEAEALSLLAKIIGTERTDAEPEAAKDLIHACGLLPLALRIAAARLVLDRTGRIEDLAARLRPGARLDTLRIPGDPRASLVAAFDHSYVVLEAEPRCAFRLIGLVPDVDLTVDSVAALAGVANAAARAILEHLTAAHLVERISGRYAVHDLVREYAAARAMAEDDQPTRAEAVGRLTGWWLRNVDAAASLVSTPPVRLALPAEFAGPILPFDTHSRALEWLDAERANLVATIHHAAASHDPQAAWLLADFLRGYFRRGMHLAEWIGAAEAAIQAADAAPAKAGRRAGAISELSLALAYQAMGRPGAAVAHFTVALSRARRAGWPEVEASAIGNLGVMAWRGGDMTQAARRLRRAVGIARRIGSPGIEANNLGNLGVLHQALGQLTAAVKAFQELIPLFQRIGSREGEAHANSNMSDALMHLGQPADAVAYGTRAAELFRDIGDTAEAVALIHIAASRCLQRRYVDAAEHAGMALAIARRSEHRYIEVDCLDVLARVRRGQGDPMTALDLARQAVRLAVDLDDAEKRADSRLGLAETYLALGRIDDALREAKEVEELTYINGLRIREGHALTVLAEVQLAAGNPRSAAQHARDALRICRRMGELALVGRALRVRGAINAASASARAARREAASIFESMGVPGDTVEVL
jgi:DNA-binding SARP family transcriptional activator